MRVSVRHCAIGLLAASSAVFAGCQSNSPPPRIAIPDQTRGNPNATYEHDPVKPLPSQDTRAGTDIPPAPFDDEPLLNQRPPEQRAFVEAYEHVGRPRIAVLVSPQLKNGAEDELSARSIDYAAMETILADWFSGNGRVMLVSPTAARQRLTDQQMKDLQSGDPNVTKQVADQLAADVLVQVQVQPTRQAGQPAARIVAEAVNVRGGQSVGRAVVDVPPPLEKVQINKYTRFVARKIMDDMTGTWNAFPAAPSAPPPAPEGAPVAPSTPPVAPSAPPVELPAPPIAPAAPPVAPPAAPVAPSAPQAAPAPALPSAPAPTTGANPAHGPG